MKATGKTLKFRDMKEYKKFLAPPRKKEETPLQEKRLIKIEKKLQEFSTRIDNCWLEIRELKRISYKYEERNKRLGPPQRQ